MRENMKTFLDAIQNNEDLKRKVIEIDKKEQKKQPGEQLDEYIALAKEYGITLTGEDIESAGQELSDEELENVSGGFSDPIERGMLDAASIIRKLMDEEKAQQSGQDEGGSGTQN